MAKDNALDKIHDFFMTEIGKSFGNELIKITPDVIKGGLSLFQRAVDVFSETRKTTFRITGKNYEQVSVLWGLYKKTKGESIEITIIGPRNYHDHMLSVVRSYLNRNVQDQQDFIIEN